MKVDVSNFELGRLLSKRIFPTAIFMTVMLLISACQPDNTINAVRSSLQSNISFSSISTQISELEAVISEVQSSSTLSAVMNPTDQDRKNAEKIVGKIDNLISGWEVYKENLAPELLKVKLLDSNWQKAEAVVTILREDLRPAVNKVTNGGAYDSQDFIFLDSQKSLDAKILKKKIIIFDSKNPSVIRASTSSIKISESVASSSSERVKSTGIVNGTETVVGGEGVGNLIRTAMWVQTTTQNMEYDREWTIETQNVTTTIYSDGKTDIKKGAVKSIPYKQTFDAAPRISKKELSKIISYITNVQNTPKVVVTRGSASVENLYKDRLVADKQVDDSILHKTFRKTTTTTTTPVTTTKTYPKITVYNYEDGHSFIDDATDEVVAATVNEVIVGMNEVLHETMTEHVVASETTNNEIVTSVTESDATFDTTFEDKTSVIEADGKQYTTVTRHYTTTATVVTTTVTSTTPVTRKIWTDGREDLIRAETLVDNQAENTVVSDIWTKVMSELVEDVAENKTPLADALTNDHIDLGTRSVGYNPDPLSYRTDEFVGNGTNFLGTIKADYAYSRGWTGKGSLITIADTGYDVGHTDFDGAVKYTYNTQSEIKTVGASDLGMQDVVGHGSHVMGIAAGRKNETGIQGVAFDADVAVAKITDSNGYSFQRARLAAAWGRDLGSVAINVSANFKADNAFKGSIVNDGNGEFHSSHDYYSIHGYNGAKNDAVLWKVALGNDQILVNSAGNFDNDYVFGSGQMSTATDINGNLILGGQMLIVGNYDVSSDTIIGAKSGSMCTTYDSTTSTCTDAAKISDYYILAPGTDVESAYKGNTTVTMSGTSMAAPQVTGALAILHQMWPHMKGSNLVKLVTKTASKDLPNYSKTTHGNGILDLNTATQPVGATGIPTSGRTAGAIASLSGGAALGSINSNVFAALSNTIVLDEFERDFKVDLSQTKAIDTRPGSFVASQANNGNYDAYANLASSTQTLTLPQWNGISGSLKMSESGSGDYTAKVNVRTYEDDRTHFDVALGILAENGKFLNNVQEGVMGVGEKHKTQYLSLNTKHYFNETLFGFGNYQMGKTEVEASKEFSLVTGFSDLISNSWSIGAGFVPKDGWIVGATYSRPLSVMRGRMNYKVPTGRTLDGQVTFDEGSADASTKIIENDLGLFVTYKKENLSLSAFTDVRNNVAGVSGNNTIDVGLTVKIDF
jgi:hypothetical protein